MPTLKKYLITIDEFTGNTPCNGYYLYTGLTTNIVDADYLYDTPILLPISSGYTFIINLMDNIDFFYMFIVHCDGYVTTNPSSTPKKQGGYQIKFVDLRCNECV